MAATTAQTLLFARALQQPRWPSLDELDRVLTKLAERPPLVDAGACQMLRGELAQAARGETFVIQGGDCAELFADTAGSRIRAKAAQLHWLADLYRSLTGRRVVRIGRFAGQFAKPRSSSAERLPDGSAIPAYRGDAVNGREPTMTARRPDPQRLLRAYDCASEALRAVHRPLGATGPIFVSHEALLLEYEQALVRPEPSGPDEYASSAHFLWIGDRTRRPHDAHVRFASRIANPIGVKIGPSATPEEVVTLVDHLDRGALPGRLTLIVRMGAGRVAASLPSIVKALGHRAHQLIWLSDPMHGNTTTNALGQKTRLVTSIVAEMEACFVVLRRHGIPAGGLHLEMTPDEVTECLTAPGELASGAPLNRYETACDPRLNPAQAEMVIRRAAEVTT